MLDGPTRRRIQEILDRTPGVTDMRDAPNTEYPWRDGELLHVPASASVFTSRGEEGLRGMVRIVTEVLVLFEELARAVERGRL